MAGNAHSSEIEELRLRDIKNALPRLLAANRRVMGIRGSNNIRGSGFTQQIARGQAIHTALFEPDKFLVDVRDGINRDHVAVLRHHRNFIANGEYIATRLIQHDVL